MEIDSGTGGNGALWRPMRHSDLMAVVHLADVLHPDARERPEVFAEKFSLFPAGCFALERGGAVLGYAISHPWLEKDVPPLDAFLERLPAAPNCLFLHDVAIASEGRGQGAAATLVGLLSRLARRQRLALLALVSIYGSDALWGRLGFTPVRSEGISARLASYGGAAVYMTRIV